MHKRSKIYCVQALERQYKHAVADLGWFLGLHGTHLWAAPSTKKY